MTQVSGKVKEKFGKLLAQDKLRAAFIDGGGKVLPCGARRASTSATSNTTEQSATGEYRPVKAKRASRAVGRRRTDNSLATVGKTLAQQPKHIVVLRRVDIPELHEFDTPERAAEFAQKQIQSGVPASVLA